MSAVALFKAFLEDNTEKEKEISKCFPPSTKCSLPSMKFVYKSRKKEGITPFITAILHKDEFLCELLIEQDPNLYTQWHNISFTNVYHDVFMEFDSKAETLLATEPMNNVFTEFDLTTPMFWAIKCNFLSLIDKLIKRGHSVNTFVDRYTGLPALSFAIMNNKMSVVQYLLSKKLGDIHIKSAMGMTPLDIAIRSTNLDAVTLLFKNGESPNCVKHVLSPLLLAIFTNSMSMVRLILNLGADVNFGLENGKCFPPLNMAALHGQFGIVDLLIDKGADLKIRDSNGCTALHLVATGIAKRKGSNIESFLKVAQLLLDKGVQVNVLDKAGQHPLFQAVTGDEPELLEILLSTTVSPNTKLMNEITLLQAAIFQFHNSSKVSGITTNDLLMKRLRIIKLLIKKGADISIVHHMSGKTVLHGAAEVGSYDVVKIMLQNNVNINQKSFDGKVALHYAVYSGNFKVVKLLLESKAEVNIKDNVGASPFDFGIVANEFLSPEVIKLLIEYGTDIYNHAFLGLTRTYDTVVAMLKCNALKLFWNEGYPYDLMNFRSPHNIIDTLREFFNSFGPENIEIQNFERRLSPQNCKQLTDLMDAQCNFLTGVEKNNIQLVLSGLERGAQARGCSVNFRFPLHFAAMKGFTDVVKILLTKGVAPHALDIESKTPLDYAETGGSFRTYLTLLQYGACYGTNFSVSKGQKTNCHIHNLYLSINKAFVSVKRGDNQVLKKVKKLFRLQDWDEYHAIVNCVDKKGRTLMALAVQRGKSHIAEELMQYRIQAPELA